MDYYGAFQEARGLGETHPHQANCALPPPDDPLASRMVVAEAPQGSLCGGSSDDLKEGSIDDSLELDPKLVRGKLAVRRRRH
jgi:hypothetical protein